LKGLRFSENLICGTGDSGLAVGLVVVAVLLGTGIHQREKLLNRMGLDTPAKARPTCVGDSTTLQKTVILPTLDTPMVAGKNNIWCSTFQLDMIRD
jgi:hypothetical protein